MPTRGEIRAGPGPGGVAHWWPMDGAALDTLHAVISNLLAPGGFDGGAAGPKDGATVLRSTPATPKDGS